MDWFSELTGLPADDPETVRAAIAVEGDDLVWRQTGRRMRFGALSRPRLADLDPPAASAPGRLRVGEIIADITDLHADAANAGAVFQVASQFNLLEMVGSHVTPEMGIARYAHDMTQGPACAMACAAGTIYRNYLVPQHGKIGQSADRQLDMLEDFGALIGNDAKSLWQMKNGYLLPQPGGLAEVARRISRHDRAVLQGLVRVGVQTDTEVTLAGATHRVTQVYCSALPMAYQHHPDAEWEPFARLVLEAAYLATFAVAAENARKTGVRKLFLTRLGGRAFGNPQEWITAAMQTAIARFKDCALDVAIVSHSRPNPANRALFCG